MAISTTLLNNKNNPNSRPTQGQVVTGKLEGSENQEGIQMRFSFLKSKKSIKAKRVKFIFHKFGKKMRQLFACFPKKQSP